jgi:STE24 endopeptidase
MIHSMDPALQFASNTMTLVFCVALILATSLRWWLASRQIRHVAKNRHAVPKAFEQAISLSSHERAASYTVARQRLQIIDIGLGATVLLGFTLLGGIQLVIDWWSATGWPALVQGIGVVGTVIALSMLIDLPLTLVRQFRLEERFGFNRITPRMFIVDAIKGLAIGAALGIPLLAAVLWFMQNTSLWWFWAWVLWMGFNLLILVLFPTVIAPMFNRFEPMPAGPMKDRVENLLARCGFTSKGLFVMDGSKRSSHGNAYFTGLGRSKRIVFFDTLMQRLSPDEVEAVLAHELGHFHHRHIVKRIAWSFVSSLLALAALGWLAQQTWFFQGLGVTPEPDLWHAPALVLFFLVAPVFTFLLQPVSSLWSRRHEFEADRFAARTTNPAHLISALVKLYQDNASTLTPDPLHSRFYDSHPPASIRVARLASMAA